MLCEIKIIVGNAVSKNVLMKIKMAADFQWWGDQRLHRESWSRYFRDCWNSENISIETLNDILDDNEEEEKVHAYELKEKS